MSYLFDKDENEFKRIQRKSAKRSDGKGFDKVGGRGHMAMTIHGGNIYWWLAHKKNEDSIELKNVIPGNANSEENLRDVLTKDSIVNQLQYLNDDGKDITFTNVKLIDADILIDDYSEVVIKIALDNVSGG